MAKNQARSLSVGATILVGLISAGAHGALVGHWTFNEPSGNAADSSATGATGTFSTAGSVLPGRGNDGVRRYIHLERGLQQFIDMGDPAALRGQGAFTVMAWMRVPPGSTSSFSDEPGVGKTFRYGITNYTSGSVWGYAGSGGQSTGGGGITEGQWYHVAVTYDDLSTATLYVNGVQVNQNTGIGPDGVGDTTGIPFRVGRSYDNSGTGFLTGDVDEVQVYDQALNSSAISAAYNGGAAPSPLSAPGSVRGLWSLNNSSFSDSSGRNNHLSNIGGVTVVPGMVGNAASFNGSNKLTVHSDDFGGPLTNFSTGAWIKVQGSSSDAGVIGDGGADFPYDITVHNGATAYAYLDDGGNNLNVGVPSDTWTHLAHTFDGTTHRLFLNGVEVGTDSVGNTSTGPVSLPFQLGFVSTGFTGLIDEAFFTTDALSAEQIAQYMQGVPEPAGAMALAAMGGVALLRRARQ